MIAITIDFGGTNIKLGLVRDGHVLSSNVIPANSDQGIRPKLGEAEHVLKEMLARMDISLKDCVGLGVAIPGIVDSNRCKVLSINQKYDDALTVDFPAWSRDAFGLDVVMDNDTNCAILGEVRYGCAIGVQDAVSMVFGTGIGTAALIDGKLLRGKHYQAGCLGGHLVVDLNGPMCTCGNRGCIEAFTGTWALPILARSRFGFEQSALSRQPTVDYKALINCVDEGDLFSIELLDYLLKCWGAALVNLIHAYDPEVIILSGGLMQDKDRVLPHLERYVYQYAWTPWGQVKFSVAKNPNISVLLGLYSMCIDHFPAPAV